MNVELGQKVSFSATLTRNKGSFSRRYWTSNPKERTDGIIVGIRTLANGAVDHDDYGNYFVGNAYFRAYLVSYNLRRAPVYVLEGDLVLKEDPTKVFEPTLPGL